MYDKKNAERIMSNHIATCINNNKWMEICIHLIIDRCSDCLKANNSRSCYILFTREHTQSKITEEGWE